MTNEGRSALVTLGLLVSAYACGTASSGGASGAGGAAGASGENGGNAGAAAGSAGSGAAGGSIAGSGGGGGPAMGGSGGGCAAPSGSASMGAPPSMAFAVTVEDSAGLRMVTFESVAGGTDTKACVPVENISATLSPDAKGCGYAIGLFIGGTPQLGLIYPLVAKDAPGSGEAVIFLSEAPECFGGPTTMPPSEAKYTSSSGTLHVTFWDGKNLAVSFAAATLSPDAGPNVAQGPATLSGTASANLTL